MEDECGVTLTKTSLSRIERGIQPYSQQILEALATVLGAHNAGYLLIGGPMERTEVNEFLDEWFARARAKQALQPPQALTGRKRMK